MSALRELFGWEPEQDVILHGNVTALDGEVLIHSWTNVSHEARVLRAKAGTGKPVPWHWGTGNPVPAEPLP